MREWWKSLIDRKFLRANTVISIANSTELSKSRLENQYLSSKVVYLHAENLSNSQLSELIEEIAKNQNRQAFARLFEHFAPRLKAFCLKQGLPSARAEELVQETMLVVWRKSASFDKSKGSAPNWIFTIIRNKRIDMFRRERHPEFELNEALEVEDDSPMADEQLEAGQRQEIIRRALGDLPEEQRLVIFKAFFEDKPHSEVAEDLQLPIGTVKSRIRLGVARLKKLLGETQ